LNFNGKVLRISTSLFITSRSRVLEKLTVPGLVKNYPAFYGNCSRNKPPLISTEPDESNPVPHILFLQDPTIYACLFKVRSTLQVSPPTPRIYIPLCTPIRATCPTH